jgi:hypothetical protein
MNSSEGESHHSRKMQSFLSFAAGLLTNGPSAVGQMIANTYDRGVAVVSKVAAAVGSAVDDIANAIGSDGLIIWGGRSTWDIFGFNVDVNGNLASPCLVFASDSQMVLTCNGCYAKLTAGVEFSLSLKGMLLPPFMVRGC